jgi:hypothetical protein
MRRSLLALVALLVFCPAAEAAGWSYSSGETPLVPKGEKLQMLANGAAMFMCSKHFPLTFAVEISYDVSRQSLGSHPPAKVTWLVDDKAGGTGMWTHQSVFVLADSATSRKVAAAAASAKAVVGIQTGKLTSLFDVRGLATGLVRLRKACG